MYTCATKKVWSKFSVFLFAIQYRVLGLSFFDLIKVNVLAFVWHLTTKITKYARIRKFTVEDIHTEGKKTMIYQYELESITVRTYSWCITFSLRC